jgi:hypothetical protein
MAKSFKCKESGCRNIVNYTPKDIPIFKLHRMRPSVKARKSRRSKTVYLTCATGHVHPYTV